MSKSRFGLLVLPLVAATACATASSSEPDANGRSDGRNDSPTADARVDAPGIDAMVDAAPVDRTIKQTTLDTVTADNSSACGTTAGTAENSYYRAFKLSDNGITGAFNVSKVSFGVENATAGMGTAQAAQVKLYSYSGALTGTTLNTAQLTAINAINIMIDNAATPTTKDVDITGVIPAGGTLVVEIALPNGQAVGNFFYMGSNAGGETKPGYLRAPACTYTSPVTLSSIGFATMNLVINVTGR